MPFNKPNSNNPSTITFTDGSSTTSCGSVVSKWLGIETCLGRSRSLTAILIWNFDSSVISAVPEGVVPYKENEVPIGTDHTSLRREWKNLFHFIKGGNNTLSTLRRETMFIQMLEGLHPKEAEIICLVKDKNLKDLYPKITYDIVKEAYPDIVWGEHRGS